MSRLPTRADDERLLAWIKQRTAGLSAGNIAYDYDVTPEKVRVATNRVLDADVQHSGAHVLPHYWRRA